MDDPLNHLVGRLAGVKQVAPDRFIARCPAHEDNHPSLSVGATADGTPLWHCHAGCTQAAVLEAAGLTFRELLGRDQDPGAKTLTIAELAFAKRLPEAFLRSLGVADGRGGVKIPYADESGTTVAIRTRSAMRGNRFRWRSGDKTRLYGLERLRAIRTAGWVLLVEGESDCWTCWFHGIPALGIPGKSTWRSEWADHLTGLDVVLWQEPDAPDLAARIAGCLPDFTLIKAPEDTKDLSEAQIRGDDVVVLLKSLKAAAPKVSELLRRHAEQTGERLADAAAAVLDHPDPIALVEAELVARGYGGDVRVPLLGYLAMTSRVLALRPGAMPAHTLFKGPSSGGKNHALRAGLDLLPEEAFYVIDAGSARVLIYDTEPLAHRVVVFSEADSLPRDEDNPAASAIRNLLADGHLHYKVTVADPLAGGFTVLTIDKPGPSVLLTTSTQNLGPQLMTRLFEVEVPDEPEQLRAALAAQARLELGPPPPPNEALLAFQAHLQGLAPIEVFVPFAKELSTLLGRQISGPRILRDYQRLLALIKAAAVLHVNRRERDAPGRLVASVDDYTVVHRLLAPAFEASTGASSRIRDTVAAVARLLDEAPDAPVSVTEVAQALHISMPSASRRVRDAVAAGWLVNDEQRRRQRAKLRPGEPVPADGGLPSPDELRAAVAGRSVPETPHPEGLSGIPENVKTRPVSTLEDASGSSADGVFTFSRESGSGSGQTEGAGPDAAAAPDADGGPADLEPDESDWVDLPEAWPDDHSAGDELSIWGAR